MKKNKQKDLLVCPKCFSTNFAVDKDILPGGAALLTFPQAKYTCLDCGYIGEFLIVDENIYTKLKKINKN